MADESKKTSQITAEDKQSMLRRLAKIEDEAKRICHEVSEMRNDICKQSEVWIDVQEMLSERSGLSVRSRKSLGRLGVETMQDIYALTRERIAKDKNTGVICFNEICEWLEARGISVP